MHTNNYNYLTKNHSENDKDDQYHKPTDQETNIIIKTNIHIERIESFIDEITKLKDNPFRELKHGTYTVTKEFNKIEKYINDLYFFYDFRHPDLIYSPRVNAFFETYFEVVRFPILFDPDYRAKKLNEFINALRNKLESRDFKQIEQKLAYNEKRNFNSSCKYVDKLFEHHAKLLVLRIDLGYRKDRHSKIETHETALAKCQINFKNFIRTLKPQDFAKNLLGYIAKIELGHEKGYHFHVMFFYNGSKSSHDIFLSMAIGKHWMSVTHPDGIFYSCNAEASSYRKLGIGMISHNDAEKRNNLKTALGYLFKNEQNLHYKYKKKERTYFRSADLLEPKSKAGRPRKNKLVHYEHNPITIQS